MCEVISQVNMARKLLLRRIYLPRYEDISDEDEAIDLSVEHSKVTEVNTADIAASSESDSLDSVPPLSPPTSTFNSVKGTHQIHDPRSSCLAIPSLISLTPPSSDGSELKNDSQNLKKEYLDEDEEYGEGDGVLFNVKVEIKEEQDDPSDSTNVEDLEISRTCSDETTGESSVTRLFGKDSPSRTISESEYDPTRMMKLNISPVRITKVNESSEEKIFQDNLSEVKFDIARVSGEELCGTTVLQEELPKVRQSDVEIPITRKHDKELPRVRQSDAEIPITRHDKELPRGRQSNDQISIARQSAEEFTNIRWSDGKSARDRLPELSITRSCVKELSDKDFSIPVIIINKKSSIKS